MPGGQWRKKGKKADRERERWLVRSYGRPLTPPRKRCSSMWMEANARSVRVRRRTTRFLTPSFFSFPFLLALGVSLRYILASALIPLAIAPQFVHPLGSIEAQLRGYFNGKTHGCLTLFFFPSLKVQNGESQGERKEDIGVTILRQGKKRKHGQTAFFTSDSGLFCLYGLFPPILRLLFVGSIAASILSSPPIVPHLIVGGNDRRRGT